MATAEQIKALIRSHAEGDDERFFAIAMQLAAHAARKGQGRFAKELRALIDKARSKMKQHGLEASPVKPVPLVQPRGELAGLLSVSYPKTRLAEMVLEEALRSRLERVLNEQRQFAKLQEYGLSPCRKLLLVGPPGTGKTMTAGALAGEMHFPLFTILLDGLITKYMGETAAKLRLIFDAIGQTRAVYLFDEFDALGSRREAQNDVGEIRRVLNSFLQFLEQDESSSIVICATNHPDLLDRALFRRFDDVIEYELPSGDQAGEVMQARLSLLGSSRVDWQAAVRVASGLSYADIVRGCEQAAKDTILAGSLEMETERLVAALEERHTNR